MPEFPNAIHLFLTSNHHPDQSQEQISFFSVLIILSELKKMGGRGKIVVFKMKQKGVHLGLKTG